MRLLLGDAILGQKVDDGLGLDLELAGEFVDSDLIRVTHAALRFRFFFALLLFGFFRFAVVSDRPD